MADTEFALNDPLAVQRWSTSLAVEAAINQYFAKFIGAGDDALIKQQNELEKGAGEKITVGLRMKLSGDGAEGDADIEGTPAEEALTFFNDALFIDQRRKGTRTKGKMTQQRVPYNLRKQSRDALAIWFGEDQDQQIMMYLAGARGINSDFHVADTWTGRANNTLSAPDSSHTIYGGDATGAADMEAADSIGLVLVERLVALAETSDPMMLPFMVDGEKKFVLLMHTYQAYQLRTSSSENDWLAIQKAAGVRGDKNKIYKNALGEYADVILHKHRNVIRFDDYGAGANVEAARALFLGAQAGMIAYGGVTKKNRYSWNEETDDRGNKLAITGGCIYGVKKSTYNGKDFGVVAVDTACSNPNA